MAVFVLVAAVLALNLLGFRRTLAVVGRLVRPEGVSAPDDQLARQIRAVDRAAKGLGIGTCLSKSLALHVLLGRSGIDTRLRLGVRRDPVRGLHAHAWLEVAGRPITANGEDHWYPAVFPAIRPGRAA